MHVLHDLQYRIDVYMPSCRSENERKTNRPLKVVLVRNTVICLQTPQDSFVQQIECFLVAGKFLWHVPESKRSRVFLRPQFEAGVCLDLLLQMAGQCNLAGDLFNRRSACAE